MSDFDGALTPGTDESTLIFFHFTYNRTVLYLRQINESVFPSRYRDRFVEVTDLECSSIFFTIKIRR